MWPFRKREGVCVRCGMRWPQQLLDEYFTNRSGLRDQVTPLVHPPGTECSHLIFDTKDHAGIGIGVGVR